MAVDKQNVYRSLVVDMKPKQANTPPATARRCRFFCEPWDRATCFVLALAFLSTLLVGLLVIQLAADSHLDAKAAVEVARLTTRLNALDMRVDQFLKAANVRQYNQHSACRELCPEKGCPVVVFDIRGTEKLVSVDDVAKDIQAIAPCTRNIVIGTATTALPLLELADFNTIQNLSSCIEAYPGFVDVQTAGYAQVAETNTKVKGKVVDALYRRGAPRVVSVWDASQCLTGKTIANCVLVGELRFPVVRPAAYECFGGKVLFVMSSTASLMQPDSVK